MDERNCKESSCYATIAIEMTAIQLLDAPDSDQNAPQFCLGRNETTKAFPFA